MRYRGSLLQPSPRTHVPRALDKGSRCSIYTLAAALLCPIFFCHSPRSHPVPSCPVLSCPVLSCPVLSCEQESAQYSAMATELSDQDTVGTALTLQMALGFSVTVASIFAIPLVEVRFGFLLPYVGIGRARRSFHCPVRCELSLLRALTTVVSLSRICELS